MNMAARHASTNSEPGSASTEDIDRRPPRFAPPGTPDTSSTRRRVQAQPSSDGIDRRPPRVGRAAVLGQRDLPRTPVASTAEDPAIPPVDRSPPKPVDRTPPSAAGAPGGGLDDLFAASAQQGRIQRPAEDSEKKKRVRVTQPAPGDIDRTPPKPTGPPGSEEAPEAATAVDRSPPKPVDRTPPRAGGGTGGGLDDLFAASAQQGRIQRPAEDPDKRKRVRVTQPAPGDIDRTPPRFEPPKKD